MAVVAVVGVVVIVVFVDVATAFGRRLLRWLQLQLGQRGHWQWHDGRCGGCVVFVFFIMVAFAVVAVVMVVVVVAASPFPSRSS